MTVQKDLVKNIYVGNSSTKEFPFTFDISKKHPEYVKVYIVDENGIQHESTDFTIDIDSKKITYPKNGEALASNKKIVIIRELPLQQQMNLENNGPYFAEDIEQAFDDAVMVSQQLAEKLSRALAFGVEVDGSEFSTIIPMVPGKSFRVSDDGKSIETTEDPAKVLPIAESLLAQTTQQATIAYQQATAAAESALSAADSEVNAETAMTQARNSAALSQKWAEAEDSPDGQTDADSPTGDTMSAKEWALYAKQISLNIGNPVISVEEKDGNIEVTKSNGDKNTIDIADLSTEITMVGIKVNEVADSVSGIEDYVVETYREGTSWYRKYKSNWIEQGGYAEVTNTGNGVVKRTINLLVPMKDTKYNVKFNTNKNTEENFTGTTDKDSFTTTSFAYYVGNATTGAFWEVKGYMK